MSDLQEMLQWHPAFYAGLQIELQDEADRLIFENEHQLGTKPKQIDVLIIKKEDGYSIKKNIGKIFRKHNIIEYKSPTDYLSIDDFYQIYGYACFYKADTKKIDSIPIEELTISLVCKGYPRELIRHLRQNRKYTLRRQYAGVYYIQGDKIPMQLIITSRLSQKENLWLKSLTDDITRQSDAEHLLAEYREHKDNVLYQSVMDIIIRANNKKFQEAKKMCTALKELLKDEIEEMKAIMEKEMKETVEKEMKETMEKEMKAIKDQIIAESHAEGLSQGLTQGISQGLSQGAEMNLISQVHRKVKKNKSIEIIACELEESRNTIRKIYEAVIACPDVEAADIYKRLHPEK